MELAEAEMAQIDSVVVVHKACIVSVLGKTSGVPAGIAKEGPVRFVVR